MQQHKTAISEIQSQAIANNLTTQKKSEANLTPVANESLSIIQQKIYTPNNDAPNNGLIIQQPDMVAKKPFVLTQHKQNSAAASSSKPLQLKENKTGLPDNLKTGVENLSGMSMDHVKVHYNSSQPAQLNALAYAQGSNIHVAPGQEKHLPHEAWHVVQQAQGRVQPTKQFKLGVQVNDDPDLEHEADVMGKKALSLPIIQEKEISNSSFKVITNSFTPQLVSAGEVNSWAAEHNQTIALESGSETDNFKSVDLASGDITVNITEHAANHFVNRHTKKEFSFKNENIKEVNSFWDAGEDHDSVSEKAEKVIKGLKNAIKEKVEEGGGAVFSKNDTVAGYKVGYNITLNPDDDSIDEDGAYTKGSGKMNMFYPEGGDYDYYEADDLKEIRQKLQAAPHNKVLQLKKENKSHSYATVSPGTATIAQLVKLSTVEAKLTEIFTESVFANFKAALQELNIDLDNVPDSLIEKLSDPFIPNFYLPTTKEIWKKFIEKIINYEKKPIKLSNLPEVDLAEIVREEEVSEFRKGVVKTSSEKSEKINEGHLNYKQQQQYEQIKPLGQKLLNAKLTSNFALDTLIKYTSPHMLNAFEIKQKLGLSVQNIQGDLEHERLDKENELFDLEKSLAPVLRPRYAALNFHGHEFGAAARNDYGLCHMVLADHVKVNATFTCGDTFDTDMAYPLTETGVEALLRTLATDQYMFQEHLKLLSDAVYKPGDIYFDTQIHQDIDIRKDVSEIIVSTAEMRLFNMDLELVEALIDNLTGGIFVRVE